MCDDILDSILDKYMFSDEEKKEFIDIVYPIFINDNFQKRMRDDFPHHDDVPLGYHILSDAAVSYKLCGLDKYKKRGVNKRVAVICAMFHDLYVFPWQNNPLNYQKEWYNGHAFRHPLEAIINAITWFPEYFENEEEAFIIIDSVIHHMYPLPVRKVDGHALELKNWELVKDVPKVLLRNITISSNRGFKFWRFSICPSKYIEGRILSKSDKKVAFLDDCINMVRTKGLKSVYGFMSFVTGVNKNVSCYKEIVDFKKTRK